MPPAKPAGAHHGLKSPSTLVLAPTRELALQVAQAASVYGRHVPGRRIATVVGGVPSDPAKTRSRGDDRDSANGVKPRAALRP